MRLSLNLNLSLNLRSFGIYLDIGIWNLACIYIPSTSIRPYQYPDENGEKNDGLTEKKVFPTRQRKLSY